MAIIIVITVMPMPIMDELVIMFIVLLGIMALIVLTAAMPTAIWSNLWGNVIISFSALFLLKHSLNNGCDGYYCYITFLDTF